MNKIIASEFCSFLCYWWVRFSTPTFTSA